jgi:hypothetical protein
MSVRYSTISGVSSWNAKHYRHLARHILAVGVFLGYTPPAKHTGGIDHLTEAQKQLVRSAAGLVVLRERLDVKAVKGESIDAGEYCAVSNTLRRVLTTIGLKREAREINPLDDEVLRYYDEAMARTDDAETVEATP